MARIDEKELERLKAEIPLERLAEASGVKLARHGKDLVGLCPFHDDHEPSLVVSPEANLWHCLGACQAGGTVIDWVIRAEKVSFRHAVELLRERHLPSLVADPSSSCPPAKRRGGKKLERVVERSESDASLLKRVVDYYQATLKKSPEAQEYLQQRGLSAEAVEHFRLGFSDRTLGYRLPSRVSQAGKELREQLQRVGILRETGHEHFRGSVVIPIFDEAGQVAEMYGRKITSSLRKGTPRHVYLPGPHRGIFNREALAESEEIILCESLIDALTFWSAGYRNVTTAYGIEGFTEELLAAFREHGTRRVLIAFDSDEAGDRGAKKAAERLEAVGIACSRVKFPKGMDANEYALKVGPAKKSLGLVIEKAEPMGERERELALAEELILVESTPAEAPSEAAKRENEPTEADEPSEAASDEASSWLVLSDELEPECAACSAVELSGAVEVATEAESEGATTQSELSDNSSELTEAKERREEPLSESSSLLALLDARLLDEPQAEPTPPSCSPRELLVSVDAANESEGEKQQDQAEQPEPVVSCPEPQQEDTAAEPERSPALSDSQAFSPLAARAAPETLPASQKEPAPSDAKVVAGTSVSPSSCSEGNEEVTFTLGNRRWRVRGLDKNLAPGVMRINVLVSREGGGFHVDTLELYSSRQRETFVRQAATELGVEPRVVKHDLGVVLLKLEELQEAQIRAALAPKNQPRRMSDAAQAEALELLRDPGLLDRLLEDFERSGIVGERTNKLIGYLAATSRKLEAPLAVVVQSSSAAGKSSLMEAILSLMPDEERVQYSAMTGQSLFYMGETELQHKILAIVEEEGAERAAYALKLLQSEGELTIASTGKDPTTGRLVTQEYRVEGPVMIFLTTTAVDIDEELLNRCIVLTVDEGREQTRAIHERQRLAHTLEGMVARQGRTRLIELHQNAQRLLRPLHVVNPYAAALRFPDHQTRTRRDHMKYLALIDSIALLHQYQRPVKEEEHRGQRLRYLEVTKRDIEIANRLAHEVLGRSLDELPPQTRRLLGELDVMVKEQSAKQGLDRGDVRFTRRQVRGWTGWGDTQLKVHLGRLLELEYLTVHRGGHSQQYLYELLYEMQGDGGTFLPGLLGAAELEAWESAGAEGRRNRSGSDANRSGSDANRSGLESNRSGQTANRSAPGRPLVGPRSGGGRGTETSLNEQESCPKGDREGMTREKARCGRPSDSALSNVMTSYVAAAAEGASPQSGQDTNRSGLEGNRSGQTANRSGGGRPVVGPRSGGGRGDETDLNEHESCSKSEREGIGREKARYGKPINGASSNVVPSYVTDSVVTVAAAAAGTGVN